MEDYFKPKGPLKSSQPEAGGANLRDVPVFGIVKNNIDPVRSGRLQVYIADFGSDNPDDEAGWVTVSYMSPFFGAVAPKAPDTGYGSYTTNSSSYGQWNSPPDIGSTVICIFINGDPSYGFYIGCVPQPETLQMVPAIGASKDVVLNNPGEAQGYGGATQLPVTNINTNNEAIADDPAFLDQPKPVHSYSAAIMNQQGIIRDPLRGPITSSSQRESPSRVGWGVSTPGRPIYEGGFTDETAATTETKSRLDPQLKVIARRGGHSIVMDDGDVVGKDQLVRIRTAGGHQILMSDDGQTLFILHSNGQTFIEMGKEGTIDMFATNSVNVRTQGELNFHADNDINIHTKTKLNIQADSLHINTDKEMTHKVGTNYTVDVGGNETCKVGQTFVLKAGGAAGMAAAKGMNFAGGVINLNSGGIPMEPPAVTPKALLSHTDTLFDPTTGFSPAPGILKSITSRAPAHQPWVDANKGVSVKTTVNASAVLPTQPTPSVAATTTVATSAPPAAPVAAAVVATAPVPKPISAALPANMTGALVAAAATNAATGPLASAVAAGAKIVPTSGGLVAAIGSFAQSPEQLEAAGICKPGTSALVKSLIQGGATLDTALTPSMFTGLNGISDLKSYLSSTAAQVSAQITNFQLAQTGLTNAAVITGKEDPSAIAGLVMAGATSGVAATVDAVKRIGTSASALLTNPGVPTAISEAISSGNFAAKVAESTTITGSVENAFNSIKDSFGKLVPGVATALTPSPEATAAIEGQVQSIANSPAVTALRSNLENSATALVNNIAPSVASLTSKLPDLAKGAASSLANVSIPEIDKEDAADISAAIAKISSMGPASIKLPIIGERSMDRSEISSQISSLLGDAKIPKPNFGDGPAAGAVSLQEAAEKLRESIVNATEDFLKTSQAKIDEAKKKLIELTNTLPQGSLEIRNAEKEWSALVEKQSETLAKLKAQAITA